MGRGDLASLCKQDKAMNRGLLGALSPNEEVALRRIAHGIVGSNELNKRDVKRLAALDLIVVGEKGIALTELGAARVAKLPRRDTGASPGGDEYVAAMAKALGVKD